MWQEVPPQSDLWNWEENPELEGEFDAWRDHRTLTLTLSQGERGKKVSVKINLTVYQVMTVP